MKKVTLLLTVLFSFCAVNTAFAERVKGSLLRAVAKADVAVKKANERKICSRSGKQIDPETGSCGIEECQDGCTEIDLSVYNDPVLLEKAEKLMQENCEAHGGHPSHTMEFYYLELWGEQQEAAAKTAETPLTCVRCGQPIGAGQHCAATDYTGLCSPIAEENELDPILLEQAEELLQADREAHGGHPRHSLEFYYLELRAEQQEAAAKTAETPLTCVRCGQPIEAGQHCAATDYTGLCSPMAEEAENAAADQNAQAAQKHYCIYCGEEIDRDNKPCPQSNGLQTCRSTCPECGEDLNTTKNLVKNIHYCKFKGKYPIHPNTMKMITK